jgi:hypothetical protein
MRTAQRRLPTAQRQQSSCDSDGYAASAEGFWESWNVYKLPALGQV